MQMGCINTSSVDVTVWDNPTVVATAATEVCGDQTIVLNATGAQGTGGITGYNWSGPTGFISNLEDPTILATAPDHPGSGTHTYFVTVTGCKWMYRYKRGNIDRSCQSDSFD